MSPRTKEENREYMRQYRLDNRKRFLEKQRQYQAEYNQRKKTEHETALKEIKDLLKTANEYQGPEREEFEQLRAKVLSYTGRRKEIFDHLFDQSAPLMVKQFLEAKADNEKFWTEAEKKFPRFNLEELNPLLIKHYGKSWDQCTSEEKHLLRSKIETEWKCVRHEKIEAVKNAQLQRFLLKLEISQFEHLIEAVEYQMMTDNSAKSRDAKIREIVKGILWDSLIDDVSNKVKKELGK